MIIALLRRHLLPVEVPPFGSTKVIETEMFIDLGIARLAGNIIQSFLQLCLLLCKSLALGDGPMLAIWPTFGF